MNSIITAITVWPPMMFANKRIANTPCLITKPANSINQMTGTNTIFVTGERSMPGARDSQKPIGPDRCTP